MLNIITRKKNLRKITAKKDLKVSPKDTILKVMTKMTEGEYPFQIVIKNKKILGVISDSDIRRGILHGLNTNEEVKKYMNKKPVIGYIGEEKNHQYLLNSVTSPIKFLPVINKSKELKYLLIYEEEVSYKTALIMAGGFGSRLGNKTKFTPKPLLKVKKKPILEHIIEKLEKANYKNIFISTYYLHRKIELFIKKRKSISNIKIIVEKKPLGTAGSIKLLPNSVGNTITVINGDVITEVDLNALLSFHNLNKYDITLCLAKYIYNIPFGVVEFKKNNEFDKISEKPLLTKFILSGVYCINKEIFKYVGDKKLDMPDLIENKKNRKR